MIKGSIGRVGAERQERLTLDALRELSIKQLRNILAARGGAPCTTCKEKDDLVAAVMAVLDD